MWSGIFTSRARGPTIAFGALRDAGVDLCFIIADAPAARALWGLIPE
jgi:hypothetical protein